MARPPEENYPARMRELTQRNDWNGLAEMLRSAPNNGARRGAMEAMLQSRSAEALELLADVASGPEVGFNEEIVQRLGAMPGEDALRSMARILSSESTLRRAFVVSHLAKRPEPGALTMLLRGARDPSKAVSRIAERALLQRVQGEPGQLALLPRESIAGVMSFVPFEVAQELVAPQYPLHLRAEAARRLASAGGADSVTTLMWLATDKEPVLARAAWDGLRSIGSLPATFLIPFLGEKHDEIRRQGIELFARYCGGEGAMILSGLLKDRVAAVRETAVRAIHKLKGPDAVPIVARLADDPELCVRRAVLDVLAKYPIAVDVVVAVAISDEEELRSRALMALAGQGVFRQELVEEYLTFLRRNAAELKPSDDVLDAMASIAKILGREREPRALEGFKALCKSTSRRLRRTGIDALLAFPPDQRCNALATLVDTHDKQMLAAIAMALAECQDPRAVVPLIRTYVECSGRNVKQAHDYLQKDERLKNTEFLLELLAHGSASVRRYSAGNLKTCKDPKVVDPLLAASRDEDVEVQLVAIEALGGFAKTDVRVADRLIEVCGQGDVTVRQAAVEALGNAQVESAVPVLVKALFNVFLRPRAEEALKKVGGRQGYLAMKRLKRREQLFGSRYKRKKEKPKLKD